MAKNFDPRYDPAFQPGYEGPAQVSGRPAVPRSVVEPVETRTATPVEPRPGVESRPRVEPVETSSPDRSLLTSTTSPAALIETRGNPWLLALWVVAAIFVVGGIAAQFAAQSLFQGNHVGSAVDFYVLPSVLSALSPWFTLAGLFAGVAAMVLSAIRWRPEQE